MSNIQFKPPAFSIQDLLLKQVEDRMKSIKYKIMILSGKGGVGKSFVSSMLSLALASRGYRVALLDADLHGSSIPTFIGLEEAKLYLSENGIEPARGPLNVKVVSANLLLPSPETPLVWRGPLVSRAIIELLARVNWGENDFLIIDLPPGTGDEAITIVQSIKDINGAIVVTAPSMLSEIVVSKAINFVLNSGVKLLGVVENMSFFKCPKTGEKYYLLGKPNGRILAEKYNVKLLAEIPLDPLIGEALEKRQPYYIVYREGEAAKAIDTLVENLLKTLESN